MSSELVLASIAIGATGTEVLGLIIRKAREARQLSRECQKLGNLASLLLSALEHNKEALKGLNSSSELKKLLGEVLRFVLFCMREWSITQKAWEVLWKRRLPRMTKRIWDYLHVCMFESSV